MLKKIALGLGVAALSFSGVASAQDVRPGAVNFGSAAPVSAALLPAPAKAHVSKRNDLAPLLIVLIVVVAAGAIGAVAASSGSGSPG